MLRWRLERYSTSGLPRHDRVFISAVPTCISYDEHCSSPYSNCALLGLPKVPLNFASPPLTLSSATFHSRLKTELFNLSCPDSTLSPAHDHHHHRLHRIHAAPYCLISLTSSDFDQTRERKGNLTIADLI